MAFGQKNSDSRRDQIPRTVAPMTTTLVNRKKSYHIGNLQGIGSRERQEDSFAFVNAVDVRKMREEGLLFIVCDGMGGMKDGKVASETAIASIRDSFKIMNRTGNLAEQLKQSVITAADRVEEALGGEGGSTVIAGIIYDDKLYYVSVGDSYFYLKRGNGLYRLNVEHNLCNQIYRECIRDGDMNPASAREDKESTALTSFLGMTGMSEIDYFIRPLSMKPGDVLLACSDGVGGTLSEEEILPILRQNDPKLMCEDIGNQVLAHHKKNQDNYTAVVVKCCI